MLSCEATTPVKKRERNLFCKGSYKKGIDFVPDAESRKINLHLESCVELISCQ